MVNGEWNVKLPFTIYHLPFTKRLLLLVLVLLLGLRGGVRAGGGGGRLRPVFVERGLDESLVVLGGLDVGILAERAEVLLALLLGALLRYHAADEVLLEGVVALVDTQ